MLEPIRITRRGNGPADVAYLSPAVKAEDSRMSGRVLMMDLLNLVLESEGDAYRVLLVKAAGKYFLFNDMKSFFVLTRLANKLYPGHIDGEVISSKIKHMQSAGAASFEVEHGVNVL